MIEIILNRGEYEWAASADVEAIRIPSHIYLEDNDLWHNVSHYVTNPVMSHGFTMM